MADLSSLIAQFGQNTGAAPAAAVNRGVQRFRQNRLYEIARQDQQDEQARQQVANEQKRQEAERKAKTEYMQRGVAVLAQAAPEQRAQIWGGLMQGAQEQGWDISGEEQWDEARLPELMGQFGQASKSSSTDIGTYNPRDYTTESFAEFRRTGDDSVLQRYSPSRIVKSGGIDYAFDPVSEEFRPLRKTQEVAEDQAEIASKQEEARLQQQQRYKPLIAEAVREAESAAKSRGESLTEFQRAQAAMPGLEEAIADLRVLAPVATYSLAGRAWDAALKQTGFGATEGASARAKYIAIIDNQVLPLLKQTFGSAFTEAEGERLRATMGDPDATPSEKLAQLDAFIAQKYRDLETQKRELQMETGQPVEQPTPAPQPASTSGFKIISVE